MRQLVETHAGWLGPEGGQFTGLVVTLNANHLLGGDMSAAQRFNALSATDRVKLAREALQKHGAVDVALPTWAAAPAGRAADAAPAPRRTGRYTPAQVARLHRTLDVVLDRTEARGRRPTRDCRRDDDDQVNADARCDWPGRLPVEDSSIPLRDHAEASFLYGQREMGVSEPYGERAFAYRPGPARAADAGQGGDLEWMQSGAWASTGGVL